MEDYEAMILDYIDTEADWCETCEFNSRRTGKHCDTQCDELEESVNPVIARMLGEMLPESL